MENSSITNTEKFIQDAFNTLYKGGQDEAKAAAEHLIKENNINGYNLLSECFLIDGDVNKAAAVVEAGINQFPNQWQLWFKKANIESAMNSFDEAHKSYKKTLEFDGVDSELISLNIAVLFCKEEKLDEAFEFINNSNSKDYKSEFDSVRYRILFQKGNYSELISTFDDEYGDVGLLEKDDDINLGLSDIYFYVAKAYYELGIKDKALILIRRAIQTDFRNIEAMAIYRELNNQEITTDKLFLHQIERSRKLVVTTLAESEEEATGFIKDIFGDDIMIAEATQINNQENLNLKGIIEITL